MERVRAEFPQGPGAGLPDDEGNRLYQDLRELEFDREAGKLSEADYQALRERYERQAVRRLAESRESPTPDPGARDNADHRCQGKQAKLGAGRMGGGAVGRRQSSSRQSPSRSW